MAGQDYNSSICKNGHRQPMGGSKFCNYCGVSMNAPQLPANQERSEASQQKSPPPQNIQPPSIQTPQNNQNQTPNNQNFQQPPNIQNIQVPTIQPAQRFQQQQQFVQQYQPQPQFQPPMHIQTQVCRTCGGNGQGLDQNKIICQECRWLRPLMNGYRIDSAAFAWAADAKAMAALRSITPLDLAAKKVSEIVGRRWIESTFNGILLGEKQLPHIYSQAVKAARIIGMTHMPDIYVSGERAWDCLTFGTQNDSFVVIGSAIAGNFQNADMFFLLAREMGHCHAGHALWKSVIRFLMGEQSQAKGFMAGGVMNALKGGVGGMVANVVEVPLLAWARQAEITADRAGMLCIGNEEIARRVLISWSLKSSFLFKQINIEEWLRQQSEDEDESYSKLSELTTSSTPYLSRRLKLLGEYGKSREFYHWRRAITDVIRQTTPKKDVPQKTEQPKKSIQEEKKKQGKFLGVKCSNCQTAMRVPLSALEGKKNFPLNVRIRNARK